MKLRIVEEAWGINRATGESTVCTKSNTLYEASAGLTITISNGRYFTVDDINDSIITVTVHNSNPDRNKTWKIENGKSVFYFPRSMDGGYRYHIVYEDESSKNRYSIAMNVKKASGKYDITQSKFFGSPTVPHEWEERFHDDIVFFAQIRLSDIAVLDTDNRLPHTGYLYFFLDAEMYPSDNLDMWVEYYPGEPDMVIDDFNSESPIPSGLCDDYLISFAYASSECDGTKLLGVPSSEKEQDKKLLLQYDPSDFSDIPFLKDVHGYARVFFGEDESDYDAVTYKVERLHQSLTENGG